MKLGRNLNEVAQEVILQAQSKKDYIAPTTKLRMVDGNRMVVDNVGEFSINPHAHGQIGQYLNIPSAYYQRCQSEAPELLADNVNTWLRKAPEKRMLRTITQERPTLRAFLGAGYRRLDNLDLLNNIVPFMMQEYDKPLVIESCEVTETKFYLKVIAPHTERDLTTLLKPGTHQFVHEPVQSGFIVQNSEIGMGAIMAAPFCKILRCTNGLLVEEMGQRKRHSGKRIGGGGDDAQEADYFSDETKALDDAAFWSRIKDVIRACLADETVGKIFRKMAEARDMKIENKPEEVVELLGNNHQLSEGQRTSILRHLLDDGLGLNAYGLSNSITAAAQDADLSYDEATRLERLGGTVINLSPTDWKALAA